MKKRLFVSFEVPEEIKHYIANVATLLQAQKSIRCSFVRPEAIHGTLKFLGSVDPENLPKIEQQLSSIFWRPCKIQCTALELQPSQEHTKLIWISLQSAELMQLEENINNVLGAWARPEEKSFVPHITVARIKSVTNRQEFISFFQGIPFEASCFTIKEFMLQESVLTHQGAVHTIVKVYPAQS